MQRLKSAGNIAGRVLIIVLGIGILIVALGAIIFSWVDEANGSLESSGEKREYLLYVPESYDPATPTPLVISIHGFAEWPAHQRDISHWNDLADKQGFIVVYPSGTSFPKRWRTNVGAEAGNDAAKEVQFISDLIDQLQQEYTIDPNRIYANGLSNGGGMSALLGCQLAERIAAVGSVAGAYLFAMESCNPSRPVPLIAFHGTADPIVPYTGGPSSAFELPFPVVTEWMAAWAQGNGCSLDPVALPGNGDVGGVQYTQCDEDAAVIFYTIQGGGHTWPGGEPLPRWITGETTQDIDATEVMWEFFRQYSLAR
ncbi:MAG: hypothetical protein JW726_19930 [Anaerolineales bacterium]|nr:hypothetical protein [Anaerolineales bacterium]